MTRIDRRALFATGSAAALLAAVGVSAEAAPRRGGHLRAALSGGDRGESWLDVPGGRFLQAARNAVFESLTEIAADGTLQPGLASAWRSSDDARVWHFEMRDDVVFHDGAALAVEDVLGSLRAFGFEAEAGDAITVHLAEPDTAFPFRLARNGLAVFKASELASGEIANGTGLYSIRRFDPGRGFLGERVGAHRKDGSAGWVDTVELVAMSDERVRAEALRDGYVDLVDLSSAFDLSERPDIRLLTEHGVTAAGLSSSVQTALRTGPHPLDDMRFMERWWVSAG